MLTEGLIGGSWGPLGSREDVSSKEDPAEVHLGQTRMAFHAGAEDDDN